MKEIKKSDLDFFRNQISNNPTFDDKFKDDFNKFLDKISGRSSKKKKIIKYFLTAKALKDIYDEYIQDIFEGWNSS